MLALRPGQKADNALVIQECANESMADQILSIWSIGDSKPNAVGLVQWNGMGVAVYTNR